MTGGGDVPPLNAVIHAAQEACRRSGVELIGFERGWEGVLESRYLSLRGIKINPSIGGTILRSSRINLAAVPDGASIASSMIRQLGLSGIIVVGGEDTLSNAFSLKDVPVVLISKTIDNDVGKIQEGKSGKLSLDFINHFTLGYPTAALKISSFVSLKEGLRTTAYSHERIIVVESMGMHAGWLALSSCMGQPDFIVVPEFGLDYERFKEKVVRRYRAQRHLIVVVAEGARWNDGTFLSADHEEKDSFGHPRFKGSAEILARRLKEDLRGDFDTRNVNSVNPSYLYRSGSPCPLDVSCARKLGAKAVSILSKNPDARAFLVLQRSGKGFAVEEHPLAPMKSIKDFYRTVDDRFYSPDSYSATGEAKKYLSTMIREIRGTTYSTS